MHGLVSFTLDPGTLVAAGAQLIGYEQAMGATHIKSPIVTAPDGSLPTNRYIAAINMRQQAGCPVLPLFDRAFKPVDGEPLGVFPNMPLNTRGDRRTSPWIDAWTLRSSGCLGQLNRRCGTRRAIAWNEGSGLGRGLAAGSNPVPGSLKANAIATTVAGGLWYQAARRWADEGIEQTYVGFANVAAATGIDSTNPYTTGYLADVYRGLAALGVHAPYPWAGLAITALGWWTTERLAAELAAIRAQGIRQAVVDNFVTIPGITTGTEQDGHAEALAVVAEARAKGLTRILAFADIETNQQMSGPWGIGWSRGMQETNTPGGFYGNTRWDTFNAPYREVLASGVPRIHRLIWTTQPNTGYAPPTNPPPFSPDPGADPGAIVGMQFAIDVVGRPGLVDLNQWTEEAYNLMDGAPLAPSYPYPAHVIIPGALKQAASHGSDAAVDPNHAKVWLEVGAQMQVTGDTHHTDDAWAPCALVKPEQVVHGFYPLAHVKRD